MTERKSMLCIGGPLAGKRFEAKSGAGFSVPVREELPDSTSVDYQPNKSVTVEYFHYREEVFHTPQGDVFFWVLESQTPLETMKLLLESYENKLTAHTIPPRA